MKDGMVECPPFVPRRQQHDCQDDWEASSSSRYATLHGGDSQAAVGVSV